MKNIYKLAVFGIAAIAALSSCSKNEVVPSQGDANHRIEYRADGTYTYYDRAVMSQPQTWFVYVSRQ